MLLKSGEKIFLALRVKKKRDEQVQSDPHASDLEDDKVEKRAPPKASYTAFQDNRPVIDNHLLKKN